jgi:hypothetical protein
MNTISENIATLDSVMKVYSDHPTLVAQLESVKESIATIALHAKTIHSTFNREFCCECEIGHECKIRTADNELTILLQ